MRIWRNENMERRIPNARIPINISASSPLDHRKYLSSILAANSRLGNHLFELSSLYGISKKLGRVPTFFIQNQEHEQMLKDTQNVIPGLMKQFLIVNGTVPETVQPTIFGMKCCIFEDPDSLKNITAEYLHLGGHHYHSWKYFARMRTKLMSFLKVPTNNFADLPLSSEYNVVNCIHIRRTDFAGTGNHVADSDFILNSLEFIGSEERQKSDSNMSIVLFGDDFDFMEGLVNQTMSSKYKSMNSRMYISRNSPSDDILYARQHCDVVVITSPHSTFGWWMGFLSKGNQVYYTDIRFTDDLSMTSGSFNPEDYYPPYWTPIRHDDSINSTVIESLK